MREVELYEKLQKAFKEMVEKNGLAEKNIEIKGAVLSVQQAIGNPERKDFPIQTGKEKLMQACFDSSYGQAFTDMPDNFSGKLKELAVMPISNNYDRAVFISSLNAVTSSLKRADHTIHCKDEQPHKCSIQLAEMVKKDYGCPKIAFFGLQPAMVEALSGKFSLRAFDMDPDNIGKEKFGVKIESGNCDMKEVEAWADLFLVTGSTACNGTIVDFLAIKKPIIFFGTTAAGTASVLGLKRFCPESSS